MQMSRRLLALSAALFAVLMPLQAQYTTASLGGTVLDPTGAGMPGAKLTVKNVETGFTETTQSGSTGTYLFSRLPVGNYSLRVEKEGFTTYEQGGITLTVNQAANQVVTLQVGQMSQRVTVEANAELVSTRTATAGQLIEQKQVVDLPLEGRAAQSLVFLAAGTVDLTDRYCGLGCHGGVYPGEQQAGINGAGNDNVNYQLDGTDHNDTYLNMNLPFPNPDSLQEFNLQSLNMTAEYGNAAGGIVNIVTKSGTNQIHGTGFEFLRNGTVNARNFFAPRHDELRRNQFGGTVGGPIIKDKLFFFGTYQGTRVHIAPEGSIAFVPTAAERTGDFSSSSTALIDPLTGNPFPGNKIPSDRLSAPSQYFLKFIPLPNGPGRQLTFSGSPTEQTENQFMVKSDYNRGRNQFSVRYFFTDFKLPAVLPPADNILAVTERGNRVRVQNVSVNHTFTPSATLLINSTFGLNRQRGGSLSSAPFGFPDAGIKIGAPTPPEMSMFVSGGWYFGTNHDGEFDRGDFTIREVVTKHQGAHELHFGGEALRVSNHITNMYDMSGYFEFGGDITGLGLADFILGRSSYFEQGGGEFKNLKGTKYSLFVQDNYRVSRNLTLNLGLRWDPFIPYYDREGRVVCFQPGVKSARFPNAPAGMTYGGENHDQGCPVAGSNANWGNIAPRVGFAYRLTEDGKTSIRGGVGYFYTPISTHNYNPFTNIAPFAPTFFMNDVSFQDPYGSQGIQNPFPAQYGPTIPGPEVAFTLPTSIRSSFSKDYRIPLVTNWNLMIERQIGASWVTRAAYVGNKGTYLLLQREVNPAIYVPGATLGNTQDRRPYGDFSHIGMYEASGNSSYNSLQLSVEKRFSRGLQLLANYTWQKTINEGMTNPFNRAYDRGISDDDVPHVFKFSEIYQIPKMNMNRALGAVLNGWSVNSVITWQAGFPFSVYSGRDRALTGTGSQRADFTGGTVSTASGRSHGEMIQQWFDTSKFVVNPVGTWGNAGRNILRGPRLFSTNASLLKEIHPLERLMFQLRAEAFNVFNNVNFNGPDNTVTSDQFGQITSARDPRILQFGIKAVF